MFSGDNHVPGAVLWRSRTRSNAHQIAKSCNAPWNAHQIANYCTASTATTLLQVVAVPTAEKLVCERVIPSLRFEHIRPLIKHSRDDPELALGDSITSTSSSASGPESDPY
jgi:hypothetical protein